MRLINSLVKPIILPFLLLFFQLSLFLCPRKNFLNKTAVNRGFNKSRKSDRLFGFRNRSKPRCRNTAVKTQATAVRVAKSLGCIAVFSVSTAIFLDRGFDRFLKPNKRSDFRGLLKPQFFSKETAVNRGFSEIFFRGCCPLSYRK